MNEDYLIIGTDSDGKRYTWGGKYQWLEVGDYINSCLTHFYRNRVRCEQALARMKKKYKTDPLVISAGYCTFGDLWIDKDTLNLEMWP